MEKQMNPGEKKDRAQVYDRTQIGHEQTRAMNTAGTIHPGKA